ncbi:MAG: hypothetical protein NWE99_10990 [Candidatus Bathyarchaeota archaeon]|nr:hypothetical protein [Candidatus Bathyarchaeota archaeon]
MSLSKSLQRQVAQLSPGDLVCCEWCDASVGKSLGSGANVDVPVKSWGIFVGILGEKIKHIILAQNSFRYSDGFFDIDYTAIPLSWHVKISVIVKEYVPVAVAEQLFASFLRGGHRFGGGQPSAVYQSRSRVH